MANRFTNITPATFNPLSTEEILAVPLAKQQQHEVAQVQAAQLAGADVNRLAVDDPNVTAEIDKLRATQGEIEDQLMTEGIGKGINKKLLSLRRDREEFLSQAGIGGRAQNAYNAYKANEKAILANKNLSQRQKDMGLRFALNKYTQAGGVEGGAAYDPYRGADYVDVQQRALDIAKEIKPQELTNAAKDYGWQRQGDGTWRNNNVTRKELPVEVIEKIVSDALLGDEKTVGYLQDIQRIGAIQDPLELVSRAALTAGNVYARADYSRKQDMKFQPGYFSGSGIKMGGDNTFYDYDGVKNRVTFSKNLIGALDDVIAGEAKPIVSTDEYYDALTRGGFGGNVETITTGDATRGGVGEISTIRNRLNEQQRTQFADVYNRIINSGYRGITQDPNRSEQEVAKIVRDYMQDNRNFVYQDAHINTNMALGPIDSTMMLNARDAKSQSDAISQRMKLGKARVWNKNGRLVPREDFADAKIDYVGYVSADNGIQGLDGANENAEVMPHLAVITPKGGGPPEEVYVERAIFEMEGNPNQRNIFNANKLIKRTTTEATKLPELDNEIAVPNNPAYNVARVRFIKGQTKAQDQFIMQLSGPAGTTPVKPLTRQQFKNSIYKLYGVNPQ